jgi:hypothetical protein
MRVNPERVLQHVQRPRVKVVAFALAAIFFPLALGFSIDTGSQVSDEWLVILWTAFGVAFAIGLLTLDPIWDLAGRAADDFKRRVLGLRDRLPFEIRRRHRGASDDAPAAEPQVAARPTPAPPPRHRGR